MSHTILVTTPKLAKGGVDVLAAAGCRVLYVGQDQPAADLKRLLAEEPVDGIISRTLPLGAELIASAPSLKAISRHGIGYDNVDIDAAARRAIPVSIAAGSNAQSVAELALGLMLALARRVTSADAAIRAGAWPRSGAGMQLAGKTLGLVGYGCIARLLEGMAESIGMTVLAYDPKAQIDDAKKAQSIETLLASADVISLHCPLADATRNLIDAGAIARMRPSAILINTARGGLIDEAALAAALEAGQLAGAGLDTLAEEPPARSNPLLARSDVLLTPHIGGNTDAALDATARSAAENLLALLDGSPIDPALVVNKHLFDYSGAR